MRGATLFSGIGSPETACPGIDWRWQAEIDPFACAVLRHRFPNVVNLGDVNRIDPDATEPVDLIVFGSPCQSFSVAGKRLGLDDPRGNMALVGLRVVGRIRPRWVVWENVPGVLSSDGGRDFGAFLGLLAELGYGFAYRVLDAQHFGVPQRRRRVFVVGYLGDWRGAAAVLFEPESLRGDSPPSRETGQGVAPTIESGANRTGGDRPPGATVDTAGSHSLRADGLDASEDGTGRGTPLVPIQNATRGQDQNGLGVGGDAMFTLDGASQHAVAFHENQRAETTLSDTAGSLKVGGGKPGQGYPALHSGMSVRRLTPRECERLQGLPDDFTLVPYRGKPAADGPRYRAIGNSMAVPVIGWILDRVRVADAIIAAPESEAAD